jgi:hypothetical protein
MRKNLPFPIWALVLVLVLSAALSIFFWKKSRPVEAAKTAVAAPLYEAGDKPATIYLKVLDTESSKLVNMNAVIHASRLKENQIKQALLAFFNGPRSGRFQVPVPEGLALNEFYLTPAGQAVVDLSASGARKDRVGFFEEALLVRCLVDTLDGNFFEVHSVKLLLDGQEAPTLFGHYALGTSEASMAVTTTGAVPVQ